MKLGAEGFRSHIAGRNLTARASAVAPLTVSGLAVSVNLIWRGRCRAVYQAPL